MISLKKDVFSCTWTFCNMFSQSKCKVNLVNIWINALFMFRMCIIQHNQNMIIERLKFCSAAGSANNFFVVLPLCLQMHQKEEMLYLTLPLVTSLVDNWSILGRGARRYNYTYYCAIPGYSVNAASIAKVRIFPKVFLIYLTRLR
jgi:hypothetical protein